MKRAPRGKSTQPSKRARAAPSPAGRGLQARDFDEGTRRKGTDGASWVVGKTGSGVRWYRICPPGEAKKKAATKKPAPKKAATKKPAPIKAATKKPAPKKAATKKPSPKKAATKKPAPKKAATKKGLPCKNNKQKYYKGTEPSPKGKGWCASGEAEGRRRKGADGHWWVTKADSRGVIAWRRVPGKASSKKAAPKKAASKKSASGTIVLPVDERGTKKTFPIGPKVGASTADEKAVAKMLREQIFDDQEDKIPKKYRLKLHEARSIRDGKMSALVLEPQEYKMSVLRNTHYIFDHDDTVGMFFGDPVDFKNPRLDLAVTGSGSDRWYVLRRVRS